MRRVFIAGMVALLAAFAAVVATPSPATAAPLGPWCVFNIGTTVKRGTTIWGSGSMRCTAPAASAALEVVVQEHIGTLWHDRHVERRSCRGCTVNWNFSSGYSCAGHGRDGWRTQARAGWSGGIPVRSYGGRLTSNTITVTC
jgi:hypothetical protein